MDTADQWPQDQIATPSDPYGSRAVGEKKVKPQKDQAPLNCPRCHSINTKFCYYNNYSLTQPRYFCKTCRRYWTAGGSLRNVPVGGGSRKNKRSSVSNNLVPKSDQLSQFSFQNPNNYKPQENQDLNLAFPQEYHDGVDVSRFIQESSKIENKDNNIQLNLNSSYSSSTSTSLSAMELLKINSTGFASRGSNSYNTPASIQNPNMVMYASPGFQFQEFNKPQAGFQGVHGNGNNHENVMNGAADQRLIFPFGALSAKQIPSTNEAEQTKEDGNPTLYWNGMSSGGSW